MTLPLPRTVALVSLLLLSSSSTALAQYYGRTTPVHGSASDDEEQGTKSRPPLTVPRRLQLRAHVGYAMGGSIDEEDVGSATLSGGAAFGLQLGYLAYPGGRVHLSYTQQANGVELKDDISETVEKYDLTLRQVQFGGSIDTYLRPSGGRLWPHFAFSIGATQFDPDASQYSADWTFSWIVEGGITFWLFKNIGLVALVRWNGHVMQADNAAFCVQGETCVYLRSTELLFQGEVGGGVVLAL
jgi:hypothetical protein